MKRSVVMATILLSFMIFVFGCQENSKALGTNGVDVGGSASGKNQLRVTYVDVGQGDSEIVKLPDGKTILIDGGSKGKSDEVMAELNRQNIKTIDYLFITHPHEDHIGGLVEVVKKYKIGDIYMQKASTNTMVFRNFLAAIKAKGEKVKTIKEGGYLIGDKGSKLSLQSFNENLASYKELNNYSIILRLKYGSTSYLFMGDAFDSIEKKLVKSGYDIESDVLKVSHHGSRYGSYSGLLSSVRPKYSVVSVGGHNRYDHPNMATITRLKRVSKVFMTDENGTVVSTTNGKTLTIKGAR